MALSESTVFGTFTFAAVEVAALNQTGEVKFSSFFPFLFNVAGHFFLSHIQHSQVQPVLITKKNQLPLSRGPSHHNSAGQTSPWIAHTYNLLSSFSSPRRLFSPLCSPLLSTPCPLSLVFLFSAGLADSSSRPGSPPPLPRGLRVAALELEAPRPSGSLTCPQREGSEVRKVRVALLGEWAAG